MITYHNDTGLINSEIREYIPKYTSPRAILL